MVRNEQKKDEIAMLRGCEDWLLCKVIPSAYHATTDKQAAWTDYTTIDNALEQLFDIAYQIKLMDGLDRSEQIAERKKFNANKRRVLKQTFQPYEND